MSAARSDEDPQDGLFDNVIENQVLEKALERRQAAKDARSTAQGNYKQADDQAKAQLLALDLPDPEPDEPVTIRCGRFRIRIARVPSRSVAFDTDETRRTTISLLGED